MNSASTIAVLMASYNGERYIQQQLESIAEQTVRPNSLIVADDGSSDGTFAILKRFADTSDFPVRVYQREMRLGYAENFFSLMKECNADIVFLSDQDDVWHPEKIETVVSRFDSTPSLVMTHDISITRTDIDDIILTSYFSALAESCIPPSFNVKGCALAYKKELIELIGWPHAKRWTHDTWLCLLSSALGVRDYVYRPLMRHRIHGLNTSGIVFTERSGLKKKLRRLDDWLCPVSELDKFVSTCVDPRGVALFERELERLISPNQIRTNEIIQALLRKERIVRLQSSNIYRNHLSRILASLRLFANGDYRSYGNLSGLLADIKGARECRYDH